MPFKLGNSPIIYALATLSKPPWADFHLCKLPSHSLHLHITNIRSKMVAWCSSGRLSSPELTSRPSVTTDPRCSATQRAITNRRHRWGHDKVLAATLFLLKQGVCVCVLQEKDMKSRNILASSLLMNRVESESFLLRRHDSPSNTRNNSTKVKLPHIKCFAKCKSMNALLKGND